MIYAVFLMVITGCLWAGVGMNMVAVNKRRMSPVYYYGLGTFFTVILASLFIIKWGEVQWSNPCTLYMSVILISGGVVNSISQVLIIHNFGRGPRAPIWAITQSAMIIPFFVGVFAFGEKLEFLSILGMCSIIGSLVIFASAKKQSGKDAEFSYDSNKWFWVAIVCLILVGLGQAVMGIPSHWREFKDTGNLRTGLVCLGSFIGMSSNKIIRKEPYKFDGIHLIGIFAVLAVLSYWLLFKSIDILTPYAMTGIVFPVGVGTCICVFSVVNWIRDKSSFCIGEVCGVFLTLAGILMLSWPR